MLSEFLKEKIFYKMDKDDNIIVEIDGKFKATYVTTEAVVYPASP